MEIQTRHWLMITALGVIWGGAFMLMELALRGITPLWLAAGRISFAAILTAFIWRLRGGKLFLTGKRSYKRLAVVGAFSTAVPFMLLAWGLARVTSSYAGVSMASVSLLVLPLTFLFLPNDQVRKHQVFGLSVGFVGVIVLIGPEALTPGNTVIELLAQLACFGAALCYAISMVTMRSLPPIDPIGLAAVPLLIGSFVVVSFAWLFEGAPQMPDMATLFWVALLGLLPTAGANLLRVLIVREVGPVFLGLTNYQVPLWSIFLGAAVLGEELPPDLLLALCFILTGVGLAQWPALRNLWCKITQH